MYAVSVSPARTDKPSPAFIQTAAPDELDPAPGLINGIDSPHASIPPWFLYDQIGSRLFDVITVLPNYYPTRTEAEIVATNLRAMCGARDVTGAALIDLGAASCAKAPPLFDAVRPAQYVPVDISVEFLRDAVTKLQTEHPEIEMIGVGTDFSKELVLPAEVTATPRLFFYPGSSIGNYDPPEARGFLKRVRRQMDDDATLWIGVDLVKDTETLERAYDDDLGVTAAFNRNILRNVNRVAGTDFRPAEWRHVALYNEDRHRIEMHLEATRDLVVTWAAGQRPFAAGERIHTESSYKFTLESFEAVLHDAGLDTIDAWTDPQRWFAMFVVAPST
ncbi:MAG: L-histidine N(alpha)-methyltransferase [Planctomycetes bacterium]|nr:L-histidine N(alpha)-methyltransferase [Planctomycetota bacterium]